MPSPLFPRLLLRAILALLLAVNGIGPAIAAGAMHHAAPATAVTQGHAADMDAAVGDCHDGAVAQAQPPANDTAPCCEDGDCDLAGCECACLAVAVALPMPPALAPSVLPGQRPEPVVARAHASPPPGALIRPPIA